MAHESFIIRINDEEASDLYQDLVSLEVHLNDDIPATFNISLGLYKQPEDGSWSHIDDERFRVWNQVAVEVGFTDTGQEELISGYITDVRPHFDSDEGQCLLEIGGMDGSVLMDRDEKLKDWPNKKDSDIAREIFGQYGFTPEVEDTEVIHDEALSTVIQRETDYQFLRRLALRNGFAFYLQGTTAYFRPIAAGEDPQPVLAAHFGDETNLISFTAGVDALRPANVSMFQVDRLSKEVLSSGAESSEQDQLGALDASGILASGIEQGRVYVAKNAATGAPEMTALCQGLFEEGWQFVTGEGEIDAAAYEHVLKPRELVTIKGVGETYSGVYYVSYVRHYITRENYAQFFQVQRNGLLPTGDEDFSSDAGALGGLL